MAHPMFGKKFPQWWVMKLREAHTGKPLSPEHRESIRRAMQRFRGKDNPSWRGGKYIRNDYRLVICPKRFISMARGDGYVFEHRLVMAKNMDRALKTNEVVDHINRDTLDNRIENLKVYSSNATHLKKTLHKNTSHSPWYRPHFQ
jgi:hypothetical protein